MRLTVQTPGAERSVLVPVDDDTTVDQLATALQVDAAALSGQSRELARVAPLSSAGVLSGMVVPPRRRADRPAGSPRLEVVGGPFAGRSYDLADGADHVIGSGPEATLVMADPHVASAHARLTFRLGEATAPGRPQPLLARLEAAPGTEVLVNGESIAEPVEIAPIDVVQIGSSLLRIGLEPGPDADVSPDPKGMRAFNRPSRIRPSAAAPTVTLPGSKPDDSDKSPLPWLSAVIPVILGITMASVFNRPIMLLMAAASPVMVLGSYFVNRRLAQRKGERTEAQWIEEVKTARRRIAELVRLQRVEAWHDNPDPLRIRDIAVRPLARLWERRMSDADALTFRVGAGEVPLNAQLQGGERSDEAHRVGVSPAPITVDLAAGPVGIAGEGAAARSVARALLASIATLRSPRDLQLVVVCGDDAEPEWGWTQWLPHNDPATGPISLIGNTDDTRRDRIRELSTLVEHRRRLNAPPPSQIVLLVDGARDVRRLPGMVDILEGGRAVGVHVIALDTDRTRLPEECTSVLVLDDADPSMARLESAASFVPHVLVDGLALDDATEIARSLCSIEHVSGAGDEGMLPTSVRFVDVTGTDLDAPGELLQRWTNQPRRSFVTIGATAESEFAVDIAADGPHALVAGTTGSGKSEFLQTLVVSLALANRPDAVNFVLIDYKGGSAFADCERLPHTVGMVTNLDARETERALVSLDAELKRRERVLGDMGAKDLDAAWARDADAASRNRLARLIIVIDEFAELKTELPEFINGIVRIARVGRSLGVHLVLATQRPSGVVTPEMQSNINMRVALRVTDKSDSTDVLGTADAALIPPSLPGRGFLRSSSGGIPTAFQTARVAGHRRGVQRGTRSAPPVAEITWDGVGNPPSFPRKRVDSSPLDHDDTDLRALVNLAVDAARAGGIERNPSPWLLPLPPVLTIDRFASEPIEQGDIVLGLQDLPSLQTQRPLLWNPEKDGHLLFIGGARSGRTTALRTTLAQAIIRYTPADLHLYVVDYGNGALLPLADAPHTGAVITQMDGERLPRLLNRLLEDLERRQAALSAAGVGSIVEQRRKVDPRQALPFAIVAIDGWERLVATLGADQLLGFREQIMRILREGPAAGIRLVMSADRTFTGDKIASAIDTVYLLPMRDPNDYRAAGVMVRELPAHMTAGRALFGADIHEAQLAVLGRDTSGEGQAASLRAMVEQSRDHYSRFPQLAHLPTPFRVDPLPSYIGLRSAVELPTYAGLPEDGLVYAVGGDDLARFTTAWRDQSGFVVAGGRGSGRSTVLASLLHQLHAAGRRAVVVAPRESVLTEVARGQGVPIVSDTATDAATFTATVDAVAASDGRYPVTLVVDDADLMKQSPVEFGITGVAPRVSIAVAVETEAASGLFGGALAAAKRHRAGVVLSPSNPMAGTTLFGAQIPKSMLGGRSGGIGVAFVDGAWIPVRAADVRQ